MDEEAQKKVIVAAIGGEPGVLEFKFSSEDPRERTEQINHRIARADLQGLVTTVRINKADQEKGIPIPTPKGKFAHSEIGENVPEGWFRIAIAKTAAPV